MAGRPQSSFTSGSRSTRLVSSGICVTKASDGHPVIGLFSQRLLVSRAPARSFRRQPVQAEFERGQITAGRHAAAAVEAALRIRRHVVDDAGAGNDALVLVQRMFEERAGGDAVAEHHILSDHAARVRQAIGEAGRLRHQQQASRLRAIGGQDHRLGLLTHFAFLRVEINDAGHPAAVVDGDLAHVALHANFAAAGFLGDRKHGDGRTGSRAHLTAIAGTNSAIDARGAPHIGLA